MLKSIGLSIVAYFAVSVIAFGDPIKPLYVLPLFSDRLALPFWPLLVIASIAVAALIFLLPARTGLVSFKLPLFTALSMIFSVTSVGFYAGRVRSNALS